MPSMEPVPVNLENINEGAITEAFGIELRKVLANIQDVNTPATTPREIILKMKFKPHSDRVEVDTILSCSTKLASFEPNVGKVFMGADTEGKLYAFQDDPRQQVLFPAPAKPESKVVNFGPANK